MPLPLPLPLAYTKWHDWGAALIQALRPVETTAEMTPIAKRLFGPALLTNAAGTKYTVPAGARAIIRHLHVQNSTAGPIPFTMSIGADATGTRLFDAYPLAANGIIDLAVYFVLEAGEVVQAFAGTTNVLTMTLDGEVMAT